MSGTVSYADINPGDLPSGDGQFHSFAYKDAQQADVTATLTAEQLAAIKAVEVPLSVVQDPNGKNTGEATWTYSIADGAFDFLAAGETLTLTYLARVDNNYAPNNETDVRAVHDRDHRHQRQADGLGDRRRDHRADRHRQYGGRYRDRAPSPSPTST